ncbi:hypothetical protein D3C74_341630 [compost metagenome]
MLYATGFRTIDHHKKQKLGFQKDSEFAGTEYRALRGQMRTQHNMKKSLMVSIDFHLFCLHSQLNNLLFQRALLFKCSYGLLQGTLNFVPAKRFKQVIDYLGRDGLLHIIKISMATDHDKFDMRKTLAHRSN